MNTFGRKPACRLATISITIHPAGFEVAASEDVKLSRLSDVGACPYRTSPRAVAEYPHVFLVHKRIKLYPMVLDGFIQDLV
jgi:hypothetical protein